MNDQEISKSGTTVHIQWKIWRPAPSGTPSYGWHAGSLADEIWARLENLKAWNIQFCALFSQGTVSFQQLWCIAYAFLRQILLQGCFIQCEILQSPIISYLSLLFIVTTLNDNSQGTLLITVKYNIITGAHMIQFILHLVYCSLPFTPWITITLSAALIAVTECLADGICPMASQL